MTSDAITLVFDGDQTLWDFRSALDRALAETRLEIVRLTGIQLALVPTVAEISAGRDQIALQSSGARLDAVRQASFARLLADMGVRANDETIERITRFFLGRRHEMCRPYRDAVPALRTLGERYRLVLLSNGNSEPEQLGLGGLFAHTFFADDIGAEKPSPAAYAYVAAACPSRAFVSIGDSLENDIDGAHDSGWRTVWINRDNRPLPERSHPDAVLNSLDGLAAVLEQFVF